MLAAARASETCPACNATTPPNARFCPQCGSGLRAVEGTTVQATAERRQLTVVFCDLIGSSELSRRLDPEDLAGLIGRFHLCVAETMGRYGGFFARPMGDGALVFFGFPQAHEDDAERAVRASLATVEAAGAIEGPDGRALQVKIGIATGVTIVGDLVNAGSDRGLDVSGEAPNLAHRLQTLAEPGTVLVSDNLRRMLGPLFVYRDLGRHALKGWEAPVAIAQVLRPAANPSRFDARTNRQLMPLLGRGAEISRLMASWRAARQGVGRVVLITGEPGIGKSRLTAELVAGTIFDAHARLRWFCFAHQQGVALYPFIQHVEHAAGLMPEDPPELRRTKLDTVLRDAPEDEFTLIANLLTVPFDRRSSVMQSSLQRRRDRTQDALLNWLTRFCGRRPVLGILEDAHWADPSTVEVLDLLVSRVASLPLLLLVTARPEFRPDWIGRDGVEEIVLSPLGPSDGAELVRSMAGRATLAEDVVTAIVARSDGVPLFLEEVTKAVLETDDRIPDASMRGGPAAVPASIHASLLARLDRLGSSRGIAEAAATIGREFSTVLLEHTLDRDDADLHDAIQHLVDAGLVLPCGAPGSGRFRFKHALIQDTAYGLMLRDRRRLLHERIAFALESALPRTAATEPQIVAHHFTEARLVEKAVGWWLRAGTQSLMRAATSEAMAQLLGGLELNASLPETEARWRQELDLRIMYSKAIVASQGHGSPSFAAECVRMRALCAELHAPPQLLTVLFFDWTRALLHAELASARRQADELLSLGRRRDDQVWEFLGSYAAGFTELHLGSFRTAREFLRRALELFEPERRESYGTVGDPRVLLHTYLAWERMCAGHFSAAWAICDAALTEARALRQAYSLAHALTKQAHIHLSMGLPATASPIADELQALSDEHGIALYGAFATCFRGWCRASLGDLKGGLAMVQRSTVLYRETGTRLNMPSLLRVEAELLGLAGDARRGLAKISEARALLSETGERMEDAELRRTEGVLLEQTGDIAGAEQALAAAHDVAVAQGARLFALRARTSLAELLSRQARHAEARAALSGTVRRVPPAANVPDVLRARQLLRALR
ncbi:MAG: AAA family ATPase [Alphaproteobacteria bacterium]|nr:AAA family ATPase [Alphaproteobacteria bacterium]